MKQLLNLVWSIGLLAVLAGCGPAGPPMGEVTGTVTYKGQPLVTGDVLFVPETANLPYAQARIAEDGTFQMQTEEHGNGVPVGKYQVMITSLKDLGPENGMLALIPARYSSTAESGLTAEVVDGENTVDFALK